MAALEQPALILCDIDLDGEMDGFTLIERIRAFSDTPIVVVSSRDNDNDILRAFELGIDDYVTKPFNPKILLARINALLARCQHTDSREADSEISIAHITINQPCRQVYKDGEEVHLTKTEFNLLLELAKNRGRVLTHDALLQAVWGGEFRNEVDYLRSYVHVLRRKLEKDPAAPQLILSKPGIGYILVSERSNDQGVTP